MFSLALPGAVEASGKCRVDERAAAGGSVLVTVFCPAGESEMPVFSVLVDTLDDSNAGARRLNKVWIFSYARPSLLQRAQALFPVFISSGRAGGGDVERIPAPVADLSRPTHQTWRRLAALVAQAELLDVRGAIVRAPTRSYRGNASSYKQMKIAEALAALEAADVTTGAGAPGAISTDQWRDLEARLALSARLLGGLVSDAGVESAWARLATQEQERRGHNWDLLRQRAEANGFYFEPLDFGALAPAEAVVWVAKPDLEAADPGRRFDRAFLGFDNPWTDQNLKRWTGYEETWYLDEQQRRCAADSPGAHPVAMIPLAIYSLTYPRAPLLLVDFRSSARTQRREVAARVANYVTLGVFGLTGLANWEYMAGHAAWQWYRQRHGAATDQAERLNAYAELRLAVLMGSGLDPAFRELIARRVDAVPLSPFGEPLEREAAIARSQYQALLGYADSSMEEQLAKDRGREMTPLVHGRPARAFFTAGTILTAGLYHHREAVIPPLLAGLARERRTRFVVAAMEKIVRSGPDIDTAWDPAIVDGYLDELADLRVPGGPDDRTVPGLIERVFAKTSNQETRLRCLVCLARLSSPSSREMLGRLMERPDVSNSLRSAAELLQANGPAELPEIPSLDAPSAASFRGK